MAGVPALRGSTAAVALAAYAALLVAIVLGFAPDLLGAGPAMVVLFALPFVLGAAVGRLWIVTVVFVIVVATALLPDRTTVETSGNSVTYTTSSTDLAPTTFFAMIAATVAYMGASIGYKLRRLG